MQKNTCEVYIVRSTKSFKGWFQRFLTLAGEKKTVTVSVGLGFWKKAPTKTKRSAWSAWPLTLAKIKSQKKHNRAPGFSNKTDE